jgi:hypothetical protein
MKETHSGKKYHLLGNKLNTLVADRWPYSGHQAQTGKSLALGKEQKPSKTRSMRAGGVIGGGEQT